MHSIQMPSFHFLDADDADNADKLLKFRKLNFQEYRSVEVALRLGV